MTRRFLFVASLSFATLASAQAVPTKLNFTARLVDAGAPVQGSRDFVFKLYPTMMLGTAIWTETRNAVPVVDGAVNLDLGASTPLTDAIFDGQTLYLEVTIGTTVLAPRTAVVSVPYALRSTVASRIGVLTEPEIQKRVTTGCATGSAIRAIAADGTVTCQAAAVTAATDGGVQGITGVYGGAGLTGGAATGDVNLAVSFSGSGTATTVARGDHNHTGTYLPLGPVLACTGADKVVSINGTTGSVVCAPDTNTAYGFVSGGGLALNGSNQFSIAPCTSGQMLVAGVGGAWSCSAPATGVLSVSCVTPIISSGGVNPSLSLGTVGISNGGTSATTALGARSALGAATAGANSDITSLTGLTTPLPLTEGGTGGIDRVTARASLQAAALGANSDITSLSGLTTPLSSAQGGTGLGTPASSGLFLKSGVGVWTATSLTAADVPAGSGSYIQNQTGSAQAGGLFVSSSVRTTGMTRFGSETGTGEPPRVDANAGGFNGLITRRVNSTTIGLGSIVGRTDQLVLQRDGTNTGFQLVKTGGASLRQTCICHGVTGAGASLNKVINVSAGDASGTVYTVYTTAEDIVMFDCIFGGMDTAINTIGHHTELSMARTNTGIIFFGTLNSTYNQ